MSNLFGRFLKKPLQIGSVADSSPWLADAMIKQADLAGPILELGAGTGPITTRILKSLPATSTLELVEIDPELARHLRKRFPKLLVKEQDAEQALADTTRSYRTIFSGIPFAVVQKKKRHHMFQLIKERLKSGGRFIMFQYSVSTEKELREVFGKANVTTIFEPRNIPPAFVYVCKKA